MGHTNYTVGKKYSILLIILCFNVFIYSCRTAKNVTYFKNIPDSLSSSVAYHHTKYDEPKINCGDVLSISIQTIDQRVVEMISGSNATNGLPGATTQGVISNNYLVDQNGYIELA